MFSPAQTTKIVRWATGQLVDKVPVSTLADQFQVQPTLIYTWVRNGLFQRFLGDFSGLTSGSDVFKAPAAMSEVSREMWVHE